jgi:hypothetical protein
MLGICIFEKLGALELKLHVLSHPILCDLGLGNMYNLRENMANSTGE